MSEQEQVSNGERMKKKTVREKKEPHTKRTAFYENVHENID